MTNEDASTEPSRRSDEQAREQTAEQTAADDLVVRVEGLYKIFGPQTERALDLLDEGADKEEILRRTGCTVAIQNASFDVRRGEIFVVMGLSGSGKSTVIRCLNRLVDPTKGRILVGDGETAEDVAQMSDERLREVRRTSMSMVFQHFGLLPGRSVRRNVELGLEISGVSPEERREKADEAIRQVGLEGYEQSFPDELSGGMQQRVGLARALANDSEILLMDEAFSALDPLIRAQMQDELLELQAEMHKTVIFITHDLDEALKLGDRILILGPGGTVRQIGTPEAILSEPADDYVERFVENVDRTRVLTAGSLMKKAQPVNAAKDGPAAAVRRMESLGSSSVFVVDGDQRLLGVVHIEEAVDEREDGGRDLDPILHVDEVYTTTPDTHLAELMGRAFESRYPLAVVNDAGKLLGILDRATVLAEVSAESTALRHLADGPLGEAQVDA